MHEIEKLIYLSDNSRIESDVQKVIIIGGMALVNKINKGKSMKTFKDIAEMFTMQLLKESEPYKEVRLIFDRYLENSLKNRTRQKRISGVNFRYIIGDNTNMEAMTTKRFLSHIQTKHALTVYLAQFAKEAFRAIDKKYVIVYDTKCESNLPNFDGMLLSHNQEEADTLIVLHGNRRCKTKSI